MPCIRHSSRHSGFPTTIAPKGYMSWRKRTLRYRQRGQVLFVLVEITMFPGRSREAKRPLYRAIVQNLSALGIASQDVLIVLQESVMEDWGICGGIPADEVDLGFRVDV